MTEARKLQCVFYSHVWSVHLLQHAGLGSFENAVLAELAGHSNLAPVFGVNAKDRYGLSGLLVFRDCLEKIAARFKNVPAPMVLAPNPPTTEAALESAISLLPTTKARFDKVTLLVHVNDAAKFASCYQYVDEFSVLWDVADYPTAALEQLARVLVTGHCMADGRWRGFHLCNHPLRELADADQRSAAFAGVLSEFPTLAVAA